jgi:hypothetical protein
MPATNRLVVHNLAKLALATADYESAWRASTAASSTFACKTEQGQMSDAYARQVAAREALLEAEIDPQLGCAIEAALVLAAARTSGVRLAPHRNRDSSFANDSRAAKFINETIAEGGIV